MGALKAARAFTGRPNVIKVEGAYHGTYDHAEASLASDPTNWGDAVAPATVPYASGTPASVIDEVGIIHFNDAEEPVPPSNARRSVGCGAARCDAEPGRAADDRARVHRCGARGNLRWGRCWCSMR